VALLDQDELRELVARLAAIERPSASHGERRAAQLIEDELRSAGARARLEEEDAHGTYWWPIGLLTGVAAAAGFARRRSAGAIVGALAAAAVIDDVTGGSQWFRRRLLPRRTTVNVVAEVGTEDAERALLIVAHHDAAHSGLVFHPDLPRSIARRFPGFWRRQQTTPGTLWGAVGGPVLVALGALLGLRVARFAGSVLSAGYAAAMVDIGTRGTVPGANDNLTGVATLISLARSLRDEPIPGLRVILLSTGSEESFMEGMQAFARRHFTMLERERTHVICLDTVGSPHLVALEGEGMVWMNEYPKDFLALINESAEQLGIYLYPNLRLRNATDGLIALRAGYSTATFGSVDDFKLPTNYHWPTDTPENVDYGTVADAGRLCRAVLERLATSYSQPARRKKR
jgi:hypothetical protein